MRAFNPLRLLMDATTLKELVQTTLEDNKAHEVTALDVRELTGVTDYFIVATATSSRHGKSLADKVIEAGKSNGVRPLGVEGDSTGEWILIDLADVVVHIMLAEQREFYSIEKLWTVTEEVRKKTTP